MISLIFQLLVLMRIFRPSESYCNINKEKSKLCCRDINLILDYHNERRNLVAGGKTNLEQAKDMWVLKWNRELAKVAQEYANKCTRRNNLGLPVYIGENIAWFGSSENYMADMKELIGGWYEEINDFKQNGSGVQHVTQMIWADTKYIGCGVIFYDDGKNSRKRYQTLLVCNYQPVGDINEQLPYKKFDDIRCSRGVQSEIYTSLCAHDENHANGTYRPRCNKNLFRHNKSFKLRPTAISLLIFLILSL
ncbi:unnamed protein product [Nezara viridula]|uniref:SCP domain-containing protein n=1 Tax=Nezara viridula TaxID=85310 RepID=A0A9P0HSD0_NEZVI|nr:unnamed protein product [Nezara viridula]